jgi:hypothetical protein
MRKLFKFEEKCFREKFLASFKANNDPYMAHGTLLALNVCRQCFEELNKIV